MIVYIEGKTLVKGVRLKDVYYIGTVEDDGYIYFNDNIAYRLPTPSNIQENVNVNLSDVQVLYPSRKAWVRANYFTELKCIGVDPKGIYGDLNDHDSRLTELENWRLLEVEPTLRNHEQRITQNEQDLVQLTLYVQAVEQRVTNLETILGDLGTALYNYSVDSSGNVTTNTFGTVAGWMKGMAAHDQTRQFERNNFNTRITTINNTLNEHDRRITSNKDAVDLLNTHLGDFYNNIVVGSTYTTLTQWLLAKANELSALDNTVGEHTTDIRNLKTNYNTLSGTVGQHSTAINGLRQDLNGLGNRTNALENAVGTWTGGATTMAMAISGLLVSMGTLPSWASDVGSALNLINDNTSTRTNHLLDWVNSLGHQALGDGSAAAWTGNGEVLLTTINTLNSVIDYLNQTVISVPSRISASVYWNWNTKTF